MSMSNVVQHPSSPGAMLEWIEEVMSMGGEIVALGIVGDDCAIRATQTDEMTVYYILSRGCHAIMSGDPGYE